MKLEENILIAGCGGGYDIFTGLPIYFKLLSKYKNIYLANFSLTKMELLEKFEKICDGLRIVNSKMEINTKDLNFPEYMLAKNLNMDIYCFYDDGLKNLCKSYDTLVKMLDIKTIILCDGGCDSILTGNEEYLGTIIEDLMSIYAVNELIKQNKIKNTYLTCLGMNVDTFLDFSVKHDDMIKCIDNLKNDKGIIETEILEKGTIYVDKYIEILEKSNPGFSTINSCILAALEGNKGKYIHPYLKIKHFDDDDKKYFNINEETNTLFIFDLNVVIKNNVLIDKITDLDDSDDIDTYIMGHNMLLFPSEEI